MSIPPPSSKRVSSSERLLATIPHFSIFLAILSFAILDGLFSIHNGFILNTIALLICPVSCFVIFFVNPSHSQFVASHSLQAGIFHSILACLVGLVLLIFRDAFDGAEAMLPAMILMPCMGIWPLLPFLAGIMSLSGKDFKYPIIWELVKNEI